MMAGPFFVPSSPAMRPWNELSETEQVELRVAYDADNQNLPKTCDINAKNRRFRDWLAERGVEFPFDDTPRDAALNPGESLAERFSRWTSG